MSGIGTTGEAAPFASNELPIIESLPLEVVIVLDADKQQAQAIGIVMALFAGALVSLAQIVESVDARDTSSVSWQALRILLYGAIMLDLSGAFLSLITIKMCSDIPLAHYQRQFRGNKGSRYAVTPTKVVEPWSRLGILRSTGMSPRYTFVDESSKWVLIFACVCTFASLTLWVFLNTQVAATAGITMILFVPAAVIVIGAFLIAVVGEGWE